MTRTADLRRRVFTLAATATALLACADAATAPAGAADAAALARGGSAGERSDAVLASITWEETAGALIATHRLSPPAAARVYALVSVAQYGGLVAADFGGGRAQFEVRRGAVGGAAVQVLSLIFPDAAPALEQQLAAAGDGGSGRTHPQFTRGVAAGRAMGDVMRARAAADGFDLAWDGVPLPSGPGLWLAAPSGAPAGYQFATMRPLLMTTASQFRPPPPPAFGSAEFEDGLAAVRLAAETRGQRETDIANFWNVNGLGYWFAHGAEFVTAAGLDEREAARVFALVGIALYDATIGCFDAKYEYLLVRPRQADPRITLVLGPPGAPYGQPNHPAYPSGHSCHSAAAATVLAAFFPAHAAQLDAWVAEAGISRLYGGLHYPFDISAGQALGRATALWALAYDQEHGLLAAVGRPEAARRR
jgi:hypothetical protein